MSSHRFLLRRVWHLAIPTPPSMGYSPTEYAEFTEPPAEMSSHGFLLRRVWHLAIPTPLAMGYSPTEYAEFTEPPTETPPTNFSLGGYGILPYPRRLLWDIPPRNTPNTQNLLLRCPPTDFTDLHRYLGCAVLPQNSQNTQNLSAWVWQGCHTLLHLCSSVPSVGGSSLQEVLCIRCIPWELLHRLFYWCSRDCCTPGGIHGSSVQISPFHLEPSLLHVLPVLWVRLRHHLRLVDAQPGEHDRRRCERHRHAVVVVGVDRL